MYSLIRKLLFLLPPERAHRLTLSLLNCTPTAFLTQSIGKPIDLMGLTFPNRLGMSAGIDNNGDYLKGLAKFGFGFIELGGVTPKAQPGNPRPRIFRLVDDNAIINRMGFPNKGVDYLCKKIAESNYQGVLGVNIAKNKETSLANAVTDYLYCLEKLYQHVSYLTINISSPNTPGLRELQQVSYIDCLFKELKAKRDRLSEKHGRYVPLLVKLTLDLADEDLKATIECLHQLEVDGFVFSNTTISRNGLQSISNEQGGLSGRPLFDASTKKLKLIRQLSDKPIVGVGGISSVADAREKIKHGADLVQLYTGLVYQGPALIKAIVEGIEV